MAARRWRRRTPSSSPSSPTGAATRAATCGSSRSPTRRPGPRRQAGALGRRQHPRRRADRDRGGVRPAAAPRRRSRRGDPTVTAALATRTFYVVPRVNPDGAEWALADTPRFRRSSTRPWPWSDAHRWPGLARRGRRRRRSSAADALRRSRRGVDGAPRRRAPARAAGRRRARRRRAALPPRSTRARSSTTTASRSRRRARPRDSTSTATSRPGGAPGCSDRATTRCRSRRSTPSCGRSSPVPTCAATTPSTPAAACCCARRRRSPTRRCRRSTCGRGSSSGEVGTRAHRLPGALGVRGLHVGQGRDDERGRRRLGVRAPRRVRLDDGVLGRRPGRHRHQAVDRLLVRRADRRAGARRAALGRRARPRRVRRLVPVRAPAARRRRARRLAVHRDLDEPAARPAAGRGHAHAAFAVAQAMASPRLEIRHTQVVDLGGGTWRVEVGVANTRLAADAGVRAGGQGEPRPADRRRARAATAWPWSAARRGCSSASSGPRRDALPRGATAHRTACWRLGGARRARGPRPSSPSATTGPAGSSAGCARRREFMTFPISF